ncbi:hypothetical protein CEE34_08930 [Candidatus Aerophobetes bacterium Ae_b3a]|nr:MAG: hypothetical protein CEE34_08930 [Candidatus Aerophobetes bacterium Ae_b3a]
MSSVKRGLGLGLVKKVIMFIDGTVKILMGINWRIPLRFRTWKVMLAIGIPVFIGVVVVVGIELTSSPEFCSSCHNMKPYYENWETSSHNEVNCIKCHSDPGLVPYLKTKANGLIEAAIYLSGKFPTSYQTEVSDESCLREGCHSQEKLKEEKVDFEKGISFEHETHFETLKGQFRLRCTSCHSQIVQDEHISVATSTCFSCHFKKEEPNEGIAECTLCHSALAEMTEVKFNHEPIVKAGMNCLNCHKEPIKGEGEVDQEKCLFCHSEPDRLERINETSFLHLKHTSENKVECFQCHRQIRHAGEEWPL